MQSMHYFEFLYCYIHLVVSFMYVNIVLSIFQHIHLTGLVLMFWRMSVNQKPEKLYIDFFLNLQDHGLDLRLPPKSSNVHLLQYDSELDVHDS